MLNIKNMGPIAFRKYIQGKAVYIFGAGRALDSCLDLYFRGVKIFEIIDNDPSLWGKVIEHNQEKIEIANIEKLVAEVKKRGIKQSVLMITSAFYAAEIVEELDKIPELDGLECFLQVVIRNTKEESEPFQFTKGEQKIPKKIHYIWIGKKTLPDEFKKNIETWQKYNPDYEIIQWNETNYDFTKCDYVYEAYKSQEWGFASNYARLDIIYTEGGIYLDTDVEVIQNFDVLLNDDAFFNMGCGDRINNGCGFGARANHPLIKEIMMEYENAHFICDYGKLSKRPGHIYLHQAIKRYGFELINQYQNIDGVALYPSEVMSPLTIGEMQNFQSAKTISIHKEVGSWKNENEKKGYQKLKEIIKTKIKSTV